jgi:TRAP-type C4-dicarboxylate transport system permease small subunit
MIKFIDRLTERAGVVAAWMLFSIGMMVTYEVVMRKVFNAPTVWADEMARFFQIWAIYLASAYVLKNRQLITVELFASALHEKTGRLFDFFTLAIITVFCSVAIWYGSSIVYESIEQGRHTSTMLGVPKWMTESAIPLTFLLLLLQTIVETIKLVRLGPEGSISGCSDVEHVEE